MSITVEWLGRIPGLAIPERTESARTAIKPARLLVGAAWLAQALVLAAIAYYLFSDATASLLVLPFLAAAFVGRVVYRDGGSIPFTVAAATATVLAAGLTEMGLTALFILFAG